jgi:2,3-dihydroxybenzoate-AMP ligase
VVIKQGHSLKLEEVVVFLKSLGAGMLLTPERLELIDELPKTAVGKIDKKALRKDIADKVAAEAALA